MNTLYGKHRYPKCIKIKTDTSSIDRYFKSCNSTKFVINNLIIHKSLFVIGFSFIVTLQLLKFRDIKINDFIIVKNLN